MTKKQIKGIVIMLQVFLIISLFLPVGKVIGTTVSDKTSLSVFQIIDSYAGMGFSDDALFYMILACAFPTAVIFSVIFLKERINFGASVVLCALYASASACFYSSAKRKMVDYATINLFPYLIILISLLSMIILILGFFSTYDKENEGKISKGK